MLTTSPRYSVSVQRDAVERVLLHHRSIAEVARQLRCSPQSVTNWNVVALTNASGSAVERIRYDAFGRITWLNAAFAVKANSAYSWNRTFTGQVLDDETDLMLYRNRFYHTELGRFVSRDPIGLHRN